MNKFRRVSFIRASIWAIAITLPLAGCDEPSNSAPQKSSSSTSRLLSQSASRLSGNLSSRSSEKSSSQSSGNYSSRVSENSSPRVSGPIDWQPRRTFVFVASMVKFKHSDIFDSFPTENRRDTQVVKFFRDAGVPAENMVFLRDNQATHAAINREFVSLLRKTGPDDTLFFFYQGHGYRSEEGEDRDAFFAAYDTDNDSVPGWSVNSITPAIDKYFKGKQAILTADCCYSGYLAETVRRHQGRIPYACLSSSSAREVSTGHWTFTDCLLDALHGKPYVDLNRDGVITVGELATHARDDMAIAEEQHSTFATAGGFSPATILAGAAPQPRAPIGQRVKAKQDGVWYAARVIATKGKELAVSYIGYDEDPEWFKSDDRSNIRFVNLKPAKTFPVGSKVEVKWEGDWYPARVLKVENGIHFIHYIEDDSSWDEWVSAKRIRAPR